MGLAINCALRVSLFDRIVVSTDDGEIGLEAAQRGAEVMERPAELAQDDTPMVAVVNHALLEHPEADIVVLLQPTAPLRRPEHIMRALSMLRHDIGEPTSVVSVVETTSPEWTFGLDLDGFLLNPCRAVRRQDLEPAFVRDGTVYAFHASNVALYGNIYGPRALPLIIPRMQSCNVDQEFDLELAEWLMKRGGTT